jgi:elongation factor Ts
MAITAQDVNKLRKMTGAGMMDCKKALTEADGDFDAAVDIIRKRGQIIASKRADREATEGAVLSRVDATGKYGAIIVLNCETDFVAKNEGFVALASSILDVAIASKPANLEALKALDLGGVSVADKVTEQSGVIGEKIELSAFEVVEAESVSAYIHAGNKLATIVGFNQPSVDAQAGKDVAMQIAAMSPIAVDRNSVDKATVDHELEIGRDMARNEGKPEAMLDKIAQGRLNKFFKESTLMEQEFIKDSKMSIGQYLESVSKGLAPVAFKRISLTN